MIPLLFLLLVNEGRWHLFVEEVTHRVDDQAKLLTFL